MFPKSLYPFVLVGLAAALQPHLAHAQGGGTALSLEEDRRRTLYQQGKEAIKAQHWADAKARLTDAWSIRPSYDVALSLSQAEFNLEHFAESAQYLAYYFRNVSAKENENNLTNAKRAFEAVQAKVGAVAVTAPQGAEILVDGKVVGRAPMGTNAFVAPGMHTFEARLGERRAQQEVQAIAGQERQISFGFEESARSAEPDARAAAVGAGLPDESAPVAPLELGTKRSLVPVYAGAGLAAVGIGVGIGFAVAASSDRNDIDALKRKNGPSGCLGDASADCSTQKDAAQSRDRHVTYEVIGFSVAGAALIGAATYLLWPRSQSTTGTVREPFELGGVACQDGARLWILGNF
jgi:hypothetical protein